MSKNLIARLKLLGGCPDLVFDQERFEVVRVEEYFYIYARD